MARRFPLGNILDGARRKAWIWRIFWYDTHRLRFPYGGTYGEADCRERGTSCEPGFSMHGTLLDTDGALQMDWQVGAQVASDRVTVSVTVGMAISARSSAGGGYTLGPISVPLSYGEASWKRVLATETHVSRCSRRT